MPMTISTFLYFNENINGDDETLYPLEDTVELSNFYIEPPESLVQKTIQAVLAL